MYSPAPSKVTVEADIIIAPEEEYTPGVRVRPARSAVGTKMLSVSFKSVVDCLETAAE
jgi:hypothetical protein